MTFSISGTYPIVEMMYSNGPIAAIFVKGPTTKFIKIKPILNKCFVCKYGWFYLDDSMRMPVGKTPVYYYTGNHVKPLSGPALKDIEIYLKKNKKAELEQLQAWVTEQFTKQEEADYKEQHKQGDSAVFDQTGEMPYVDPISQEEQPAPITTETRQVLKTLRSPINWNTENFLSSYNRCDPQSFRTIIKEVKQAKKQLDTMESKAMKTVIPLTFFGIAAVAIMIGMSQGPQIIESMSGLFDGLDISGLSQWSNTDYTNLPDPFTPDEGIDVDEEPIPPEDQEGDLLDDVLDQVTGEG